MCDYISMHEQNKHLQRVSRNPAISKMEPFVRIVNGFNPLAIVTKNSILDVLGVLS